jgi:acyl-CoA hydrolase
MMPQHEDKYCSRCGSLFECKLGTITQCHCFEIPLNREEIVYMGERYSDCLCQNCLQKTKNEYKRMQDYQERIKEAETRIFKVVFPNTTNHYDTLFGGTALQMMDEVAFITATRFARKRVVTVSSSKIDFKKPIPADTIIEVVGRVSRIGNTSLDIRVEIYKEEMYETKREKAIEGIFTFVALDQHKQPTSVL